MHYSKSSIKTIAALSLLAIAGLPLQAAALTEEEKLGEKLYGDNIISKGPLITCEACHSTAKGPLGWDWGWPSSFTDEAAKSIGLGVSKGFLLNLGSRNSPMAGYAAFTPRFQQNADGEYFGGLFWDGRVDTLAHQAEGPVLNPVEMAMSSEWAVISKLKKSSYYVERFNSIYGNDLDSIPSNLNAPSSETAPPEVYEVYTNMAAAIGEFEKTASFNKFTSKYDFYLAGQAQLTTREKRGMNLFNGKANCSTCHTSTMQEDVDGNPFPPMFTNYRYYNIGTPHRSGLGAVSEPDPGLAGNLKVILDGREAEELGKFKVPSLRNVEITGLYMHNGVFRDLGDVIHFFNTRDKLRENGTNKSFGFGIWQWPAPETRENEVTDTVGYLGLSSVEERDIELFLNTLTDNYRGQDTSPWTSAGQKIIKKISAETQAALED